MRFTDYDLRLAAYAVIIDHDQVLLTWFNGGTRGTRPCWSLPGGGVEYDESIEDAIVREVYEETGFHVRLGTPLTTHSFTSSDGPRPPRPYKSVGIVYEAMITGGRLGTTEVGGTTDRAAWVPLAAGAGTEPRAGIVEIALDAWYRRRAGQR